MGSLMSMAKVMKQTMSSANQPGDGANLTMLAYGVSLRGPRKLSPAEAMTQHKFRALLLIKQHLSTQLNASRETMLQQRQIRLALWPHCMTTSRPSAEPTGSCTVGFWTANLSKNNGHQDTQRQKPKGLPGQDQLVSQVYQEQIIHLTGSGAYQFTITHTDATSGITAEQASASTKQHAWSMSAIRAHSKHQGLVL